MMLETLKNSSCAAMLLNDAPSKEFQMTQDFLRLLTAEKSANPEEAKYNFYLVKSNAEIHAGIALCVSALAAFSSIKG